MTRMEWQQLAERWLVDAKYLLDNQRWSAAYYIAGYAVECGLKSCVLVNLAKNLGEIFEPGNLFEKPRIHDIVKLVEIAGLKDIRKLATDGNNALKQNWLAVEEWNEAVRYANTPQREAEKLYNAIVDENNGVMQWIRGRW